MLGMAKLLLKEFNHSKDVAALYTHHAAAGGKEQNMALRLATKYNMVYHPYIALTPDYREKIELTEKVDKEIIGKDEIK